MIIAIPDPHLRYKVIDQILEKENGNYDKIIMLGDEFDNFYDTPLQNKEMAEWLKPKLHNNKFICLYGNHDVSYFRPNICRCSGYTPEKEKAIKSVLEDKDWKKFKFFHYENNILFSHAGFSNKLLPIGAEPLKFLKEQSKEATKCLFNNKSHWILEAGKCRGGYKPYGGLLWDDFRYEFESISGLKQLFGHTPIEAAAETESGDWCIDTWAEGVYTYAMIGVDGKVEIKFLS